MAKLSHCKGCGADISHRRGPAVWCEGCADENRRANQPTYMRNFLAAHPNYHRNWQRKTRALERKVARRCPPAAHAPALAAGG